MKEFLKKEWILKNLLTILCVVSVVLLFLPFASGSVEVQSDFMDMSTKTTVTGFNAVTDGILGYSLLVGPVLLVAMNYIKQLDKYKSILAIVVPILCVIVVIITFIQCKGTIAKASGGGASVEVSVSLGIGAILLVLSYLGTLIAGAMTFHNLTLDKAGLQKLKEDLANLPKNAQEKFSGSAQAPSGEGNATAKTNTENVNLGRNVSSKKTTATSTNRATEILALIEKLSQMKDSGVLTEEEFAAKKKELLEEI